MAYFFSGRDGFRPHQPCPSPFGMGWLCDYPRGYGHALQRPLAGACTSLPISGLQGPRPPGPSCPHPESMTQGSRPPLQPRTLSWVHLSREDWSIFSSSLSVEGDGSIPRGRRWIWALTSLSGVLCLPVGSFSFQGREQKALRGCCFAQGHAASQELLLLGRKCQDSCHLIPTSFRLVPSPSPEPFCGWRHPSLLPSPTPKPTADVSWLGVPWLPSRLGGASGPTGCRQVTCGAHRAGLSLRMLQHSSPAGGGTGLGPFPTHLSECLAPAQPTGHLALAGPECAGLCRRNAASVFPDLGGQSFLGTLPVGRGTGRHRRDNWTPRVIAQ